MACLPQVSFPPILFPVITMLYHNKKCEVQISFDQSYAMHTSSKRQKKPAPEITGRWLLAPVLVYPAILAVSRIHGKDTQQHTWKVSHNLHSALGQKACWCFSLASLLHGNTAKTTATPARHNLLSSSTLSCYIALTAGKTTYSHSFCSDIDVTTQAKQQWGRSDLTPNK